jgi:hypothetical protein
VSDEIDWLKGVKDSGRGFHGRRKKKYEPIVIPNTTGRVLDGDELEQRKRELEERDGTGKGSKL